MQVEPSVPIDFDDHKMRTWSTVDGKTFEAGFVMIFGDKVWLESKRGRHHKLPLTDFSEEDRTFMELARIPTLKIDFNAKSSSSTLKTSPFSDTEVPPRVLDYVFGAELDQTSMGSYNHELLVELFAIGAERAGDRYILLDHQEVRCTLSDENGRSPEFSGEEAVRLISYDLFGTLRGEEYASYLVVISDSRGKIIAHKTTKKWLFENLGNLRQLPVGRYMDETCTRVFPTRPTTDRY